MDFLEVSKVKSAMVRQLSSQTKLLIVDDDAELCAMLKQFFGEAGFVVDSELNGDRGAARAETGGYDLMILDVTLPGLNGLGVLRRIRRESSLPVLMLTAKAERSDRIAGLDLGADDYLSKPFFPDELLARVRAILRRSAGASSNATEALQIGDLRLFPGDRSAHFRGQPLGLTAMEYEILQQLMRCCGQVVSRDSLSLHLYDRLPTPFDRSVDQHVSRLRQKLGLGRNMILSVRGVGYQLRCPEPSGER
ncbi:MAG: response regulator transcription factor [Bryobacteraceae bacterium]